MENFLCFVLLLSPTSRWDDRLVGWGGDLGDGKSKKEKTYIYKLLARQNSRSSGPAGPIVVVFVVVVVVEVELIVV